MAGTAGGADAAADDATDAVTAMARRRSFRMTASRSPICSTRSKISTVRRPGIASRAMAATARPPKPRPRKLHATMRRRPNNARPGAARARAGRKPSRTRRAGARPCANPPRSARQRAGALADSAAADAGDLQHRRRQRRHAQARLVGQAAAGRQGLAHDRDRAPGKMKSAWVERDAKGAVDRYGRAGIAPELALRVYSTRLIGRDPKLVLHGGGNTSRQGQGARSCRRRSRGALRQGFRLGHGRDRAGRLAGGAACPAAGLARARGRCPTRTWRACCAPF